ncbi:hypothetical protein BKA82DRAFT_3214379 [Pisolithus tinctorius]|nr:hypothetical protein BKA82DRAFT_3214379 [Pisolithus tinctorius]
MWQRKVTIRIWHTSHLLATASCISSRLIQSKWTATEIHPHHCPLRDTMQAIETHGDCGTNCLVLIQATALMGLDRKNAWKDLTTGVNADSRCSEGF